MTFEPEKAARTPVTLAFHARIADRVLVEVYVDGERIGTLAPDHVTWERMRAGQVEFLTAVRT
jgi:hypothetical protein